MADNRQNDEKHGVLFVNEKRMSGNAPDFTGTITINGQEYRLACWKKVSAAGRPYLSLAAEIPQPKQQTAPAPKAGNDDDDPFGGIFD